MILDKENYESRGVIKGFFSFVWSLFTFSKVEKISAQISPSQGIPIFDLGPSNSFACQTCRDCEAICPTNAIEVKGENGKAPKDFLVDPLRCTSCMECVEICPTKALRPLGRGIGAFHVEASKPLSKKELMALSQSTE
jgi:formate hydrogenlyase subunit 6/NADH:ubiquinone oxidoreductase subunit I